MRRGEAGSRYPTDMGVPPMNIRARLGLLAAIVLLAVAVLLAGGSAGGGVSPVAEAAEATSHQHGAQVAISGSIDLGQASGPISLSGGGYFNFGSTEGELTMAMNGLPEGIGVTSNGLSITELFKSGSLYMSSPAFDGKLPGGARWMKLDLSAFEQAVGVNPTSLTSGDSNPEEYLKLLTAGGATFSTAGEEVLRGVRTTRYNGTIDLLKAAEAEASNPALARSAYAAIANQTGLHSIPMSVWVDGHGLVRKLAMDMALDAGGAAVTMDFGAEYFSFGPTPTVHPPADSEVFDATQQALAQIPHAG